MLQFLNFVFFSFSYSSQRKWYHSWSVWSRIREMDRRFWRQRENHHMVSSWSWRFIYFLPPSPKKCIFFNFRLHKLQPFCFQGSPSLKGSNCMLFLSSCSSKVSNLRQFAALWYIFVIIHYWKTYSALDFLFLTVDQTRFFFLPDACSSPFFTQNVLLAVVAVSPRTRPPSPVFYFSVFEFRYDFPFWSLNGKNLENP